MPRNHFAVWEPETPGNYFGGALLDGDAAILALQLDYTNAYPAQFAAMYFGGSQRSLVELTGELQWLLPSPGKEALASYRTEEGAFGVYRLSPLTAARMLCCCRLMRTPEPMGGDLAVCGDRFCYAYAKMAKSPCAPPPTARRDALTPAGVLRKLDSFWLTADGPLISANMSSRTARRSGCLHALCLWRDARGHTPGCGRRAVSAPLCKRLRLCREWQLGASAPAACRGWHGQLPRCNGVAR